jgi:hypothetical protein
MTVGPILLVAGARLQPSCDCPNAFRLDMRFAMAETPKLSVEKALEKLRSADALKSRNERRTEDMDALDDEIKRMRAQRLRLDRHQRRPTKSD